MSLIGTQSGLLGQGFDDPRSAAIMALSAGLLQRNLAGGLLGANNAYAQGKQAQRQAEFDQMRMDAMKEEQALNKQKLAQAAALEAEKSAFLRRMAGGDAVYAPGQLGSGSFGAIQNDAPMSPAQRRAGGLASLTPEDVMYAETRLGIKALEPWKIAKQGFEQKPGSYRIDPSTNQREYIPDPKEGYTVQNGVVGTMPGWMDQQVQRTLATEGPKALLGAAGRVNQRTMPDGSISVVSELSENPTLQGVLGNIFGGAPIPRQGQGAPAAAAQGGMIPRERFPTIAPDAQRAADQDAMRVIRSELASETDPTKRAGLERELARFEAAQSRPGFPTSTAAVTPAQGRYGKTTAQQTAEEVDKTRQL